MSDDVTLRPVREDDLPVLQALTTGPDTAGELPAWGRRSRAASSGGACHELTLPRTLFNPAAELSDIAPEVVDDLVSAVPEGIAPA